MQEIGAILLPLFSFPMTVFLILAHYRNQLVYVNDPQNEEAKSLYKFSRFATYFSVIVIQLTHLWFVNDPQESYPKAVGFVGHYIPYALFQTALVVIAMMQVSPFLSSKIFLIKCTRQLLTPYLDGSFHRLNMTSSRKASHTECPKEWPASMLCTLAF